MAIICEGDMSNDPSSAASMGLSALVVCMPIYIYIRQYPHPHLDVIGALQQTELEGTRLEGKQRSDVRVSGFHV